jgi:hypothetical protein
MPVLVMRADSVPFPFAFTAADDGVVDKLYLSNPLFHPRTHGPDGCPESQTCFLLALPRIHLGDFGCVAADVIDLTRPIPTIWYEASLPTCFPDFALLLLLLRFAFHLCQQRIGLVVCGCLHSYLIGSESAQS